MDLKATCVIRSVILSHFKFGKSPNEKLLLKN